MWLVSWAIAAKAMNVLWPASSVMKTPEKPFWSARLATSRIFSSGTASWMMMPERLSRIGVYCGLVAVAPAASRPARRHRGGLLGKDLLGHADGIFPIASRDQRIVGGIDDAGQFRPAQLDDLVAQDGGPLELQVLGGFLHLPL